MQKKIFYQQLPPNTLILTANQRLANYLWQHYPRLRGNVLPFDTWLNQCFIDINTRTGLKPVPTISENAGAGFKPARTLLTPSQEQIIWEDIIAADAPVIAQKHHLAKLAMNAYELLRHWHIPLNHPTLSNSIDSRQLVQWAKKFTQICNENHWTSRADLYESIVGVGTGRDLSLLGWFDKIPAREKLFATLREQGIKIAQYNCPSVETPYRASLRAFGFDNVEQEIIAMAKWAKDLFDQDSTKRIGCIVPHLYELQPILKRTFAKFFQPEQFNLSLGTPLIKEPSVYTELLILKSKHTELTPNEISYLLRSPLLATNEQELAERALLDAKIRKNKLPITNDELRIIKNEYMERLQTVPYAKLLNELESLKLIKPNLSLKEEYEYLFDLANKTLSQPHNITPCVETPYRASLQKQLYTPIQILGTLEAVGLPFTDTWMMSMNNRSFPASASPNPLLPLKLQRQYNLPHSSNERELSVAKQLLENFLTHTDNMMFSYSEWDGEEKLYPSKLITNYELQITNCTKSHDAVGTGRDLSTNVYHSYNPNYMDRSRPVPTTSNEKISGGSKIINYQAQCPFKAFAKIRLHSESVAEYDDDSQFKLERGKLVHHALEIIWREIRSHENLLQLSDAQLDEIIDRSCRDRSRPVRISTELEKNCVTKLLRELLELEKQRAPFVIKQLEFSHTMQINNLPIKLRIDRIDQLPNGKHVVIDYKTGYVNPSSLRGEQPDDFQLPLYAIAMEQINQPVSAVAYAKVNAKGVDLISLGEAIMNNEKNCRDRSRPVHADEDDWQEQLNKWKEIISKIADDFLNGNADVKPKQAITCDNCDLQTLCRIYE